MLKKIISVKNIGRFINSAAPSNPQLAKYTLISGANGYGKTTLCAILRSLQTGEPAHVIGRKTLGVADNSSVELLLDSGAVRFDGTSWNATLPHLSIFDGTFVAENVYSGEVVEIEQKRSLYRVIIGREGAQLAEKESQLSAASRAKTSEITLAEKQVQPYIPTGMTLGQFAVLQVDPDIDAKITTQQRTLEAVRLAGQIAARAPLGEFNLPPMPGNFCTLLAKTLENVAADAEQQLAEHLSAHGMGTNSAWLAAGLPHASHDRCPFCGQDTKGLSLISAYRAIFSDSFKALKAELAEMKAAVSQLFGEGAVGRLMTLAEQNKGSTEFWGRYCQFDPVPLTVPSGIPLAIQTLEQAASALLNRKIGSPLEVGFPDTAFTEALKVYEELQAKMGEIDTAISTVNALISAKKIEACALDIKSVESALSLLNAIKKRHEPAAAAACADWSRLKDEKGAIEKQKTDVRTRLNAHTQQVVRPYEEKINNYLDSFNAGFRIADTKHAFPGGVATSSYQLVINRTAVQLGDGKTSIQKPSFKNTLSAGDRTTLALAFFLAHLELDSDYGRKIVVFDDPFNSQDVFRRRQTVHEIIRVGECCAQLVVLSHDNTFLNEVWKKAPPSDRVALQIYNARIEGTKISEFDLEKACQGRMASEIDDLQAYVATGAGNPLDLIKKMRVVVETYCRTTYPACFCDTDWLGGIISKIRVTDAHPASPLCDELEQINDYSKQYHHGESMADSPPAQIDADELTGFVRRTLKIVNALQA